MMIRCPPCSELFLSGGEAHETIWILKNPAVKGVTGFEQLGTPCLMLGMCGW
jgi:hypothetical protein